MALLLAGLALADALTPIHPQDKLIPFVKTLGYDVEAHTAITADGDALLLHRIKNEGGPVVLLQHGLLASSWCWFTRADPAVSLPFVLHGKGYDVWLTNNRGDAFSTNATVAKNKKFWDFTFEDMASADVPTNIDFILGETQQPSLTFVGWSQGNTQFMQAAVTQPDLASKVNLYIGLSPVVYLTNTGSGLLAALAKFHLGGALHALDKTSFLLGGKGLGKFEEFFCKISLGAICKFSVKLLAGHSDFDDKKLIENLAAHFPAGTSTKDIFHWQQYVDNGKFARFDYGKKKNKERYGQDMPPLYDLSTMPNIPIAFFSGTADALVANEDRERMMAEITSSPTANIIFNGVYDEFSHVTWFTGNSTTHHWQDDLYKILAQQHALR
jgi:pimeloyl-ACP methyl ester carboxylesterase